MISDILWITLGGAILFAVGQTCLARWVAGAMQRDEFQPLHRGPSSHVATRAK